MSDEHGGGPGADADGGWGRASLYAGGTPIDDARDEPYPQPRTFTEADPISASIPIAGEPAPHWSPVTYVGRRKYRPGRTPAAETIRSHHATAAPTDEALPALERPEPPAAEAAGSAGSAESAEAADKGLLANSRTMAIASLVSRITGFLRSSMLVAAIGIHGVGDAYNAANNFPNMVYELLLGGVLSSVLVPLLVHAQERDDDGGVAYTQRLLSIATAALGLMTLLAVLCAPLLAAAFVPAGPQRSLTSIFATLLLPEIFFYGLGAMFMAVLNIRNSYGPGAWAPVLNNVVMLVTLGVFFAMPGPKTLDPATITTPQVLVLGIGTTLGIAGQALVLIPALRATGFHWRWRFRALPHEVGRLREVSVLAGWVFGYVVASQIGVTTIAKVGLAHGGAFTVFTNADLLVQMPYGILVVSLLTALMPRLSRAAARGETEAVVADLGLGARLSAVALLPITAGLIAMGAPLCITLFAYGETSIRGGELIGTALAASAFGLFPFALVMLQLRVFYAMRDARTPTLINCAMVGTKVLLVILAGVTFDSATHVAEALTVSTSLSYVVGAVVGHLLLTRRIGLLGFRSVAGTTARIGGAAVLGGVVAYLIVLGARSWLGLGHAGALLGLIGGSVAGLAVLAVLVWRMRMPELAEIRALARR